MSAGDAGFGSGKPDAVSAGCRSHGWQCGTGSGDSEEAGCAILETILPDKSIRRRVGSGRCGQSGGISDQYFTPGAGWRDHEHSGGRDADRRNHCERSGTADFMSAAGAY